MILRLLLFVILSSYQVIAKDLCSIYYSQDRKFISIDDAYPTIQIYEANGYHFKLINLQHLPPTSFWYQKIFTYLNETYPGVLKRDEEFVQNIIKANTVLWKQMHVLLMFDVTNKDQVIAGASFISVRTPKEKLGLEAELKINVVNRGALPFIPVTEIGRLSLTANRSDRTRVVDNLLSTLFKIANASSKYKDVFLYTSKKLRESYEIKGYHFIEIPELENESSIDPIDVVLKLKI